MPHINACAVLFALVSLLSARAEGVTIHRSFRGGYPSAVSEARRNSVEKGATFGTRVSPRTKIAAYKKIAGKVTQVDEGDVIWVANASGRHKIRLDMIDAPEIGQPYGEDATRFLSDLVLDKEVEVLKGIADVVKPFYQFAGTLVGVVRDAVEVTMNGVAIRYVSYQFIVHNIIKKD